MAGGELCFKFYRCSHSSLEGTQPGQRPECHRVLRQDGRARASSPSPSSSPLHRRPRAAGFPYTRTEPPVCQIRKQLVFTFHLLTEGFCSVNKNCAQLQKKERRRFSVKVFMNIFILFWLQKKIFNDFVFLHKTER